jgi:hypothetical protein
MYVFVYTKFLYDQMGVSELQKRLLGYFEAHQEVQQEWDKYNANYDKVKYDFGEGKNGIRDVYSELDKKWDPRGTIAEVE